MCFQINPIYLMYLYKQDLALNNQQKKREKSSNKKMSNSLEDIKPRLAPSPTQDFEFLLLDRLPYQN